MIREREPPRRARGGAGGPAGLAAAPAETPSIWPGIAIGAALGAVVGIVSLFVPGSSPAPEATAAPVASSSPAPPASAAEPQNESENDYVHRAQSLLGSAPEQALAMAEAHPLKYPGGKFGQEREIVAIRALHALKRQTEAKARARVLLMMFPSSPYRGRLENLLPELVESEKPAAP